MSVRALVMIALLACATRQPKTESSMRAARLASPGCARACPTGGYVVPVEPQGEHVLEDCCYDADGLTWSSCAWNGTGRYLTLEQILAPSRLIGGCGGDGWPDCKAQP